MATVGDVTLPIMTVDPREAPNDLFVYVDIGSIDNRSNRITNPKSLYGRAAPSRARQLLRTGDTLFSTVRTYLRKIGFVDPSLSGAIGSTGFAVLRPAEGVHPRLLYYYALTDVFVNGLSAQMRGTSYPAVVESQVRSMPIPVPPTAEQGRIVGAIEEQFSRLDAGVAALDSAVRKLESFRQSVLRTMRSGSWDRVPFGTLVNNFDGRRVPVKASQRHKGSYPYYGAQGIIDYVDGFVFDGDYVLVAEDGENLSSRKLPIALQVHGQFWVNNHAHVVQPKPGILADYLAAVLNADPLAGAITGTAQPKLTQKALNRLPIPTPSLEEQRMLVAYMDRAATSHDYSRQALIGASQRVIALRSSILATAFSGTLVPQDPYDEPAPLLLERIATKRASPHVNYQRRVRKSRTAREKVLA
jgi:type I restriction enzyme S subunit